MFLNSGEATLSNILVILWAPADDLKPERVVESKSSDYFEFSRLNTEKVLF
jgi:hypothetical protein